ncbi:MAG: tetratricopeptide repeat protein [Spirochaetaceae bacterium]|jgi:tetratricopeptide (TPR) repeat protein|nr:tetratricopeptide repeat protein [Spirochaetaceae bacterium]
MPSLKQLKEFKLSFLDIGREGAALFEQNIPDDDLPLPDSEPVAPPPPAETGAGLDGADAAGLDGDGLEPDAEEFDFSTFLDTIPDDLSIPDPGLPDIPEAAGPAPDGLPGDGLPPPVEDDEFKDSDALLRGLADDVESPPADSGPAGSGDFPEDLDFSAEPDFGEDLLTNPGPEDEASGDDLPSAEDFGDFSIPDMDLDSDLGEEAETPPPDFPPAPEPPPAFEAPPPEASGPGDEAGAPSPDVSEDLLSDTGPAPDGEEPLPAEPETVDSGDLTLSIPETELDNIEIPIPRNDIPEDVPGPEPETADTFEDFTLDPKAPGAGFGETPPAGSGSFADLEEFSLSGLADFDASILGETEQPGPGKETVQSVEEIRLEDEDLSRLQEALGSYPLNLRIACEEIIAEQTAAPNLMSALVKLLVEGAPPKAVASLAGKILGQTIPIPKSFEKRTGEALEIEQSSFSYIFIHKFLPVLRLVAFVSLVVLSLFYLGYRFIYIPLRANSIYQAGYERIEAGEFARANERFTEAFKLHRVKNWFYRYAEAFRDMRQYIYAEEKYDELLRYYPRDKRGALDYADLETNYLNNYPKADSILRRNILDYAVDDREALLALGDTNLAWGEIDPARYEDARQAYARLLERYGWQDPIVERMMKYFIRIDDLGQVIPLQNYFLNSSRKRNITPETLAELGGYLLDKRFEEVRGVPDENISRIDGIRDILLRAVAQDPALPESHYHLARYYSRYGQGNDERQTLKTAVAAFKAAPEKSAKRVGYRIDALRRYAETLINAREFFPAEEQLTEGINLYEDGISRRLFSPSPELGRLYAVLGDLEYFVKDGNMEAAIEYYRRSERNGWAPPEMQYRMGSAYYRLRQWEPALERFFTASVEMPLNRRLLYALGNASYMRGDYHTAQGYYSRLLDTLDNERAHFPLLTPHDQSEHMELAERLMVARNNLGVTMEALAEQTGNNGYRSRALGLYAESARAWDAITRNPETMVRTGAADLSTPGVNLAYLNSRNALNPVPDYEFQIYPHIDKDVFEPSAWETLVPANYRLSDEITFYH